MKLLRKLLKILTQGRMKGGRQEVVLAPERNILEGCNFSMPWLTNRDHGMWKPGGSLSRKMAAYK